MEVLSLGAGGEGELKVAWREVIADTQGWLTEVWCLVCMDISVVVFNHSRHVKTEIDSR